MRIGIDGRFWNESGVGRYIRNLVFELSKLDKKNEYVLFVPASLSQTDLKLGSNWRVVPTDIKWHTLGEQLRFPSLLSSHNLDLVHFPYFSVPILYNKPFVVTIHDLILHHFSTGKATTLPKPLYYLKLVAYKYVIQKAAQKAKTVITVSESTKREIRDVLGIEQKKISVTYEGVDPQISSKQKIKQNEKYFLTVGNSYPHKNLERLFRAFSEIPDTRVKLYVVGQSDYFSQEMKKIATDKYRNPNIVFLSEVSDSELAILYKEAIALVHPSLMEGFGLPLLEAMQSRCLVLASNIPTSREICQDIAVYFDPLDVKAIAQVLIKTLSASKPDTARLNKGEKRAEEFSWKRMAEKTLDVYTNV